MTETTYGNCPGEASPPPVMRPLLFAGNPFESNQRTPILFYSSNILINQNFLYKIQPYPWQNKSRRRGGERNNYSWLCSHELHYEAYLVVAWTSNSLALSINITIIISLWDVTDEADRPVIDVFERLEVPTVPTPQVRSELHNFVAALDFSPFNKQATAW